MKLETMKGKLWTPEDYNAEVRDRRQQSAARTNKMRRESTRQKIIDAIGQCHAEGTKLTVTAISRIAGIDRSTVYKYHSDLLPRKN